MSHAADRRPEMRDSRSPNAFLLYFGILAPPLAWTLQENVCFGLASHDCYPFKQPLSGPAGIWGVLLAINAALLVVAAFGVVTSLVAWKDARRVAEQRPDAHSSLFGPGEGRIRAFAAAGFLVSALFVVAIGVNTISLMTLSTCSQV